MNLANCSVSRLLDNVNNLTAGGGTQSDGPGGTANDQMEIVIGGLKEEHSHSSPFSEDGGLPQESRRVSLETEAAQDSSEDESEFEPNEMEMKEVDECPFYDG